MENGRERFHKDSEKDNCSEHIITKTPQGKFVRHPRSVIKEKGKKFDVSIILVNFSKDATPKIKRGKNHIELLSASFHFSEGDKNNFKLT